MRFSSSILAMVSLAASVSASNDQPCMSQADAQQVANTFQSLIANYSDTLANATLTNNYRDFSDSVTTLINGGCTAPLPLGPATFGSRASFESGQGSQPPIPFQQLNVWSNCNNVFLRWRTAMSPEAVTGIIVLETVSAESGSKYPWLIQTVYSEFNSGAWLEDLGAFRSTCNHTAPH